MTSEVAVSRLFNKRVLTFAALFFLLSCVLFYYWFSTNQEIDTYNAQKNQEENLNNQVELLQADNNSLRDTIEQTGKELVSFSEDKLTYINLASTLSAQNSVHIDKLVVSDVWNEGTMACMTTQIEVEGELENVQKFISSYCDVRYTNRINVVSLRPIDRYPWVTRTIDGEKVLTWFDLTTEDSIWTEYISEELKNYSQAMMEAGIPVETPDLEDLIGNTDITSSTSTESTTDNEVSEESVTESSSGEVDSSEAETAEDGEDSAETSNKVELDPSAIGNGLGSMAVEIDTEDPITVDRMFEGRTFKAYLVIDFLGRQ